MRTARTIFLLLVACCLSPILAAMIPNTAAINKALRLTVQHNSHDFKRTLLSHVNRRKAPSTPRYNGMCIWDDGAATKCSLSGAALTNALSQSDDAFTRFVAQFAECNAIKDRPTCFATDNCLWDKAHWRCIVTDFSVNYEQSPCMEKSGYLIGYAHAAKCTSTRSQRMCTADSLCTWDNVQRQCFVDVLNGLYGLHSDELEKIATAMAPEWSKAFWGEFDITEEGFDWNRILEWKLPEATCPDFAKENDCEVTHSLAEAAVPKAFYCRIKYNGFMLATDCDNDPLCEYDLAADTCRLGESPSGFFDTFYTRTVDLMPKEFDQKVTKELSKCLKLSKADCTGSCYWDQTDGICSVKEAWVLDESSTLDTDGQDPLCKYLAAVAESGCVDIDTPIICNAKENCAWRGYDHECVATADYLIKTITNKDKDFETALAEMKKECSDHDSERDCAEA